MKFGGTSVGAPERLRRIVEIVLRAAETHRPVVVASAANGVTDTLVGAWDDLIAGSLDTSALRKRLYDRHSELATDVLMPTTVPLYLPSLVIGLDVLLHTLDEARENGLAERYRDSVIAAGERLSVPLVSLAIEDAGLKSIPADAASLIRTDDTFGDAIVDLHESYRLIRQWHRSLDPKLVPVVTGFIGSTRDGATTTLGRGGSDYSAALLAGGLDAEVMERWTDTDGVYSDDPRKNAGATRLAYLVLEEAWAWNQAGKLGMHRKALDPLVAASIPVHVRCTATPDLDGTMIVPAGHDARQAVAGA